MFNVATADLLNHHKSMKLKRSKQQYEKSMQESSKLVNLTNAERLEACVYKYVKPKCKIKGTIRHKLRHTFLLIYFQERNVFRKMDLRFSLNCTSWLGKDFFGKIKVIYLKNMVYSLFGEWGGEGWLVLFLPFPI